MSGSAGIPIDPGGPIWFSPPSGGATPQGNTNLQALNFDSGFGLPFTIYAPVSWAPLYSQGVNSPQPNFGSFAGGGITPDLLSAAQANLTGIEYGSLAAVQSGTQNNFSYLSNLFTGWGANLQSIAQQNANALTTVIAKS